jgi:hypothetical membrane protein
MFRANNLVIGLLFTLSSAQFLLVMMLGAAIAPEYSLHDNAISDLGVIPETALLFNASIILFGLLMILGAYLYHPLHAKPLITSVIIIAGIGSIGVGLFPLNNLGIHTIFALIAFIFANIIPVTVSLILPKPLKILSIATGIIGLFYLFVQILGDTNILNLYGPIGHGGSERMIVYLVLLWLVAFGGYIIASPKK